MFLLRCLEGSVVLRREGCLAWPDGDALLFRQAVRAVDDHLVVSIVHGQYDALDLAALTGHDPALLQGDRSRSCSHRISESLYPANREKAEARWKNCSEKTVECRRVCRSSSRADLRHRPPQCHIAHPRINLRPRDLPVPTASVGPNAGRRLCAQDETPGWIAPRRRFSCLSVSN